MAAGGGRAERGHGGRIEDEGRLHAPKVTAVPDPPSLVGLRDRVETMLSRIDPDEPIRVASPVDR